jgi:site-specific DNA recombinase
MAKLFMADHSAKTFDRPVFKDDLLPFIRGGSADLLLVSRWDRFSRDITDALVWIRRFGDWGIRVDASDQPVDLSIPQNKYMLAFYLTHPEVENDIRAANTRDGMSRAVQAGRWVSRPSIGYRMGRDESGKPVLLPDDQAPFVTEAFELVASGLSYSAVHNLLAARGFKAGKNQFYRMLDWYPYCGLIPLSEDGGGTRYIDGVHEPLVSRSLFLRVQAIRADRRKNAAHAKRQPRPEFPLRGHVLCPECDRLLTASVSRGRAGGQYAYYHCHRGCPVRLRAGHANDVVLDFLKSLQIPDDVATLYSEILDEAIEEQLEAASREASEVHNLIDRIEEKATNAADKLVEGELSPDAYERLATRYSEQKLDLVSRANGLDSGLTEIRDYVGSGCNLLTRLGDVYEQAGLEHRQLILGSIFPESLTIDEGRVRTSRTNTLVSLICREDSHLQTQKKEETADSSSLLNMVARTGFEPVLMP